MSSEIFSSLEIDAIGEILNISLGASATAVSTMLSKRVDITTPVVKVLSASEFEFSNLEPAIGVEITYVSGLSGSNIMLLKRSDVKLIVEMLMGTDIPEEEFELDEMNISAICEVMNQMMGASSTALSEFLGEMVNISTPVSFEIRSVEEFKEKYFPDADPMVVVGFTLRIEEKLESEFINVMAPSLAKSLVSAFIPELEAGETDYNSEGFQDSLDSSSEMHQDSGADFDLEPGKMLSQEEIERMLMGSMGGGDSGSQESQVSDSGDQSLQEPQNVLVQRPAAAEPATGQPDMQQPPGQPMMGQPYAQQPMMGQPYAQQPMMGQPYAQQPMMGQPYMQQPVMGGQPYMPQYVSGSQGIQPVLPVYQRASEKLDKDQAENLDLIMGVPLNVTVEIGRTRKLVKEILELGHGSLVVLNKLAGEKVDVYVNGQCIAKGDVVVIDDNFGIRITEIISKPEILK